MESFHSLPFLFGVANCKALWENDALFHHGDNGVAHYFLKWRLHC